MKVPTMLLLLLGALTAIPVATEEKTSVSYAPKTGPGQGRHVVLLAGDEEYRSEEGLPMLAKILSQRHGFNCTVLFSRRGGRNDRSEEYEIALEIPRRSIPPTLSSCCCGSASGPTKTWHGSTSC